MRSYRFARDREQNYESVDHSTCKMAILSRENGGAVRWAFLVFAAETCGLEMRHFHEEAAAVGWLTEDGKDGGR